MVDVCISLATGATREEETRDSLLHLIAHHDLRKWQFTQNVRIEEGATSHSHPILTLNTRAPDRATLLATYLHEQIHWYTSAPANATAALCAVHEWRRRYPDAPVGFPEGSRNEPSTYLHFTVCYFEYAGLIEVLGHTAALRVLEHNITRPFYRAIYRVVLRDCEEMRGVIESCGLML